MSELTDAEWLRNFEQGLAAGLTPRFEDRVRLLSIADGLERGKVEFDAWLKFEGPGDWHLETSIHTAEVQRIFGAFPDVVQNRVRIAIRTSHNQPGRTGRGMTIG